MRLRKVKQAGALLAANPNLVIQEPKQHRGNWNSLFANTGPIALEIGCGKGQFVIEMAKRLPATNFIAIEKYDSVLVRVLQKLLGEPLPNLVLVLEDAERLGEMFTSGEVRQIYLNFSDPWPKRRQEKKRLSHPAFLEKYRDILQDDGHVSFKTDNFGMYRYSLLQFNKAEDFAISRLSLDLANSGIFNIKTEFEDRFTNLGQPIFHFEAIRQRRQR